MIIPEEAGCLYMPITRNIPIDILNAGSWFNKFKLWRTTLPNELLMEDFYQILPSTVNKVFGFSDTIKLCCFIPKGFIFNGASVPRALSFMYLPTGILYLGSFLHDFMYAYAGMIVFTETMDNMLFIPASRSGADYVFNEVNEKVNDFTTGTYPAYATLRATGFVTWNKHREDKSLVADFPQFKDMYAKGINKLGSGGMLWEKLD